MYCTCVFGEQSRPMGFVFSCYLIVVVLWRSFVFEKLLGWSCFQRVGRRGVK